ncbi:MAG TPA: MBL fold metallo-hydrolase [Methanomicrobiales archaeon]|nr:MBL fold metallo-hydrolase [Methanomicrobiales archaeon]
MPVTWIPGSGFWANSYLVGSVLVDCGVLPMQVAPYRDRIGEIVLTHCHYDHTAHLMELRAMTGAKVSIHRLDGPSLGNDLLSSALLFGERAPPVSVDRLLDDGNGVGELSVIHTPGHTPGSICLYHEGEEVLISGDTVFTHGSFGRYDLPGGSLPAIRESIRKLSKYAVRGVYPGHGEPVREGGARHIAAALKALGEIHG